MCDASKPRTFDVVAFRVPEHRSLLYRRFLDREGLLRAVGDAVDKGANVISVREVVENPGIGSRRTSAHG